MLARSCVAVGLSFKGPSQVDGNAGQRVGQMFRYSNSYLMSKAIGLLSFRLSLLHSRARGVKTLDCHQIVTKSATKAAKIGKLKKTATRAI